MNKLPLVSILVPTFNREKIIERTIQSALDQDYANYEIIISDNGSDDNTWDLEFTAIFVKGKITDLVLDSAKIITTAEENAANEKAWQDKANAHEKHPWTRTKKVLNKITFNYWSTFWQNLSRIFNKWSQYFSKAQMWIIRNMY